LAIIKKVYNFGDLTDELIKSELTVQKRAFGNHKFQLSLIPQQGYTINNEIIPYSSVEFYVVFDVIVTPKNNVTSITTNDIDKFTISFTTVSDNQLTVLEKIFLVDTPVNFQKSVKARKVQISNNV
jgi:hypothetical protein